MSRRAVDFNRRRFLKTAVQMGAVLAAPQFIPAAVLGKDGAVPPSEQITLGGIGIGGRGSYVLRCFMDEPEVRFLAIADVKADRRAAVKKIADAKYGNQDCTTYRDLRDLLLRTDIDAVLIATGPNWHATAAIMAAKAGKDMYCEKPSTKNIVQSLRWPRPCGGRGASFRPARSAGVCRISPSRSSWPVAASSANLKRSTHIRRPGARNVGPSGWETPEPEPAKEKVDWDLYLGPAAWRPFNKRLLAGGEFEKGGGMVGGGVLEWGSHCVDLCQWAADADGTAPVEYGPLVKGESIATYASGVKLVIRKEGWLPLGSCPVRFEGDAGWVEAGDSGKLALSSPALLAGRKVAEIGGYPATFHVRNFLDCVKTREQPRANADVACHSHIACHAANIARYLNRTLAYDPQKNVFLGDEEANRLRSEAMREPWRV